MSKNKATMKLHTESQNAQKKCKFTYTEKKDTSNALKRTQTAITHTQTHTANTHRKHTPQTQANTGANTHKHKRRDILHAQMKTSK